MKIDRHTLTPNEINKFLYCQYQWYYERVYGRKELEKLAKERNQRLDLVDRRISNFNRGYEYHNKVKFKTGISKSFIVMIIILVLIILYIVLKVKNVI